MQRALAILLCAGACSRAHEGERAEPVATVPRDAAPPPVDARPAGSSAARAPGGPGLCAAIGVARAVAYRRDTTGRIVESLAFDAEHGAAITDRTTYRYDAAGHLAQEVQSDATHDLFYDKAGRMVRRRTRHADTKLWGGDVNVTYEWKGKPVAAPRGRIRPRVPEDLLEPIAEALPFAGTVRAAHFYDGSPAPQPETEEVYTFDERGRLVGMASNGSRDPSGSERAEWDADDQLVALHSLGYVTKFEWRDHLVVGSRFFDLDGKETEHRAYRYDAARRLIESGRVGAIPPREEVTASKLDRDTGTLAITTTMIDTGDLSRQTYAYDCGPAAP